MFHCWSQYPSELPELQKSKHQTTPETSRYLFAAQVSTAYLNDTKHVLQMVFRHLPLILLPNVVKTLRCTSSLQKR